MNVLDDVFMLQWCKIQYKKTETAQKRARQKMKDASEARTQAELSNWQRCF